MSEVNITKLIQKLHEEAIHENILKEVMEESNQALDESTLEHLHQLLKQAGSVSSKIIKFPKRSIRLAESELMAAAGQDISDWFAEPLVFSAAGMVIDIRKVIGSPNEVDVYIQPHGDETARIEKNLLPFKNKTLQVKLSINGKELLSADMYIDGSGQAAEGSGRVRTLGENDIHGNIHLDIIVDD